MKLSYDTNQLKQAAKFIYYKNTLLTYDSWKEVRKLIKSTMIRHAKEIKGKLKSDEDWSFVSTAGFTIVIFLERDEVNFLEAEITVDPAVATNRPRYKRKTI